MGVSLSTARYLAPASFLYDFAAQQYGLWSSPNMMDIHNQNLSFFSPQPYFIGAFFFPQQLFQLAWMYKLLTLNDKTPSQAKDLATIQKFVPYYALGNVCIGTWMFFWNSSRLDISNIFVIVNTLTQLWYVNTQLEPMDTRNWNSILTHVVSKTFAGIGVLDLLHNTSAAYFVGQTPSTAVKALTGVGFAALGASSDWILGGCLVYDLVGLSVGQAQYGDQSWSSLLGAYAVGTAAIVGAKNYFRPPYVSRAAPYKQVAQDEVDDRA
ncbi:hypothetical protein B0A54_06358 [Friedmanniomyces endolithicus]|uniref:Uncharacterized protein n=1 Tax=Friedmanniomyces endolithicus TaxID=329885 RepID=A0A4U0V1H7_9PEZI|nr:hypothetical protein LTS09_001865 [Friedmanniomyces endolithicus]KAK0308357.1 hypothetical protein LTR01_004984 [Friedmanniomyces endolithicus]KAK0825187.1 hypothetical protein LTR73_007141 [Friedmanniomyces endolithicus]TKA41455.1 hypothetical protein B0A54_06358 [Friedmanniomyces endolithicus]